MGICQVEEVRWAEMEMKENTTFKLQKKLLDKSSGFVF
jgi:hypothetical protein